MALSARRGALASCFSGVLVSWFPFLGGFEAVEMVSSRLAHSEPCGGTPKDCGPHVQPWRGNGGPVASDAVTVEGKPGNVHTGLLPVCCWSL